ncbi:MAG: PDR/VanB family oxidoreductase [Pseudomonadales bacterium]
MAPNLIRVRVEKKEIEAVDVASYVLVPVDGSQMPRFEAGAHIDVHIDDNIVRQYSITNNQGQLNRYLIGVLRDNNGKGGSISMHDRVEEGDILHISEPRNHFHLVEDKPRYILFAGGIGVTPIISMAQRLHDLGRDFEFHYCCRSEDRAAFTNWIKTSGFARRTHFHWDDGEKDQLLDLPALLADRAEDTQIYVCGPKGFMDWVIRTTEEHNWPEADVHREYFSADPKAGHDDDDNFTVKIASSGAEYSVGPEQTIFEVLEQNGVNVPVSCEQGICGVCVTGVLDGEPEHRDLFMTKSEQAKNDKMTICCSRAKSKSLTLDI